MQNQNPTPLNPTSFLSSIFKFSIATWVNAVIYGVSLILVSFVLDSAVFGVFDLFITASTTLMNLVMLGLDHAYIRFYNEPPNGAKDEKQLAAATMGLSLISLAVFSCLIIFVLPNETSNLFFRGQYPLLVTLLCVNTLFLVVTRYFNITYRMQHNIAMYTVQSILLQFFQRIFFLVGALLDPTLNTIVIFNVFGLGAFALVFFVIQRKTMLPKKVQFEKKVYNPLLKYGLGLAPTNIMLWLNTLFSRVFVNAVMGAAEQGVYSFISYMSLVLGIIQGGFATFWSAFIFKNYKTEQQKIIKVHDFLTFIILTLMAFLLVFQPIIFMIIGPAYRSGISIFGATLFAPMLLIISETTVYGIAIEKKTYFDTIGMGISIGLNVLLCIFLVPLYGMFGASAAGAVSGLAMFIFRTAVAQKFYQSVESLPKTAISIAIMGALVVISFVLSDSQLIVSAISLAVAVYYIVAYKKEFIYCLNMAKKILSSLIKK